MADFIIKKISHRGTTHPVVARLAIQMKDIVEFASLDKDVRDAVLGACFFELQSRLGKCWDIWQHLENELRRCDEEYQPSGERVAHVPHIDNLERDVENYLYEAKNFLRDLVNLVVVPCFPDSNLKDASAFRPTKKHPKGTFFEWANATFGDDDGFSKMIAEDQPWLTELMSKRNAREHPGGLSGKLIIQNVEMHPSGRLVAPVWQRTDTPPSSIVTDMAIYCDNLLSFAEEVIIFGCVEKNIRFRGITFASIPEEERNPESPIRFRAVFQEGAINPTD